MWLIIETEINGIGRGDGSGCWLKNRVEADACRGEIFGHKGVADGVIVNSAVLVKDIKSGGISRWRIQWETVVDQHVSVAPFRGIGVNPRLAEIVEKR